MIVIFNSIYKGTLSRMTLTNLFKLKVFLLLHFLFFIL